MLITKEWVVQDKIGSKASLLERLLAVRGITDPSDVHDFLNPMEITITHPNAFCGMRDAVDRIVQAIDAKEKILIGFYIL